jgi:glycosyltransferase involved in cell wall biosynthesis
VWKNPVHEVLEYVGEGTPTFQDSDSLIVKHAPVREEGYSERNWKILVEQWVRNGLKSGPFMAFYLMREAFARKEYALAVTVAQNLIDDVFDHPALPFHQYEAYLIQGRVYDGFGWSFTEVSGRYRRAIKLIPDLNEGKCEYALWLLNKGHFALAQEIVGQLSIDPPNTVGVVDRTCYGSHVFALSAFVNLHSRQNVAVVLSDLLRALNFPYVSPLCHEVDTWVRKTLRYQRVGLVYLESWDNEELKQAAKALVEKLKREDVFAETYVFTDPLVANYANDVYFHFGNEHSLYREECNPYVTQVLITSHDLPNNYCFGWDYVLGAEVNAEEIFATVFSPIATVVAPTFNEGSGLLKSLHEQFAVILHPDVSLSGSEAQTVSDWLNEYPNDLIAINEPPVGFAGKRDRLLRYTVGDFVDYDRVLNIATDVPDCVFHEDTVTYHPRKSIYIYAEGVEPWDGCTPYSRGIGASEASVVYLAEQLAQHYRVYVFSPTQTMQVISGVTYVPNYQFGTYPRPDVLISSRCPHILTARLAPIQILWLHDLYQHTVFPETCVFDKLVCVSYQEQRKAAQDWGYKAITIPNPYKPNNVPSSRVTGRCVWLSSPDRGIANLLRSEEAVKDLWLTYSYFNARVMRATDRTQFRCVWQEKYRLREAGVKMTGRLGLYELRRLLSTCDIWPYASNFEETFCVAALEAIGAGVYPIYSCAGATMGTVQRYTSGAWYDLDDADEVLDELERIQDYDYQQDCNREISSEVFPENVCKSWARIIQ